MTFVQKKMITSNIAKLFLPIVSFCLFLGFISTAYSKTPSFNDEKKNLKAIENLDTAVLPKEWVPVIAAFPAPESQAAKDEMATLVAMQSQRNKEVVAHIELENKALSPIDIFVVEKLFDESTKPKTLMLLNAAVDDSMIVVLKQKRKFDRIRPNVANPNLTAVIPVPPHASYPSGHATQSMVVALVLSDIDAANSQKYIALSERIGRDRELAGLHYPSDTAAGFDLAHQIVDEMKKQDAFKQMFESAKTEF